MRAKPRYRTGRRSGDDHIYKELDEGCYFREYQLQPGNVVVDAGAHAGFFTTIAAERVGPGGRVYAFEPEPDNWAVLKENTDDRANIVTVNSALWNGQGSLPLHLSHSNAEHSLVFNDALREGDVMVPCTTLDQYFGDGFFRDSLTWYTTRIDFLKIDVEGAEARVLLGGLKTIRRFRPHIAMELKEGQIPEVRDAMKQLNGYTIATHKGSLARYLYATPR